MKKKGFTLLEVIISIFIMTLIMMLVTTMAKNIFSYNSSSQASMTSQLEGRKVLKTMVAELRSMSSSAQGAYPIDTAATSTLTFYADINNDDVADKIRYFIDPINKRVRRGVIIAGGSPYNYSAAESVTTLIGDVTNGTSTAMFDYFDKNYAGTTSPMSLPINVSAIRLIRINVKIDKDPNRIPFTTIVSSDAMLRNLKDNL